MSEVGGFIFQQEHREGGAHARVNRIVQGFPANSHGSLVHRVAQPLANGIVFIKRHAIQTGLVRVVGVEEDVLYSLNSDGTGDLARGVSSHAIGDDKQPVLNINQEVVFVVFPDGAGIGPCKRFQNHGPTHHELSNIV